MSNATVQSRLAALEASLSMVQAASPALPAAAADAFWLLFNGALVFFMQCGFGMLEAGTVTAKNTQSIMLKNLFDAALACLLWWAVSARCGARPSRILPPVGRSSPAAAARRWATPSPTMAARPSWATHQAATSSVIRWRMTTPQAGPSFGSSSRLPQRPLRLSRALWQSARCCRHT
eukprot:7387266-Prymnesium_polylepis.1